MVELAYRPSDIRQDRLGRPLLTRAAHYWRTPDYQITAGRDFLRMGLGQRGSLAYGGAADPFEYVRYRDKVKLLGTRFVFDMTLGTQINAGRRSYLLTRRLEKRLSPEIELGFTDTAKLGTLPGWPNDPTTFENDNQMIQGEVYWRASPYLELYAEGAIDELDLNGVLDAIGIHGFLANWQLLADIGINVNPPGSNETQGGLLLGAYLPDVLGNDRLRFRAEYASTSRLLGISTRGEHLDYLLDGRPLQHRIGPDARSVYVEADYLSGGPWALKGFFEQTRAGLSRPTPETENLLGLRWTRELGRDTSLSIAFTHRATAQYRHVAGSRRAVTSGVIGAKWWF